MASRNNIREQSVSWQTLSTALSSAVAEWLLMLLLFLDGFFSFLVKKFAQYSKLQIPCLLCSRLDHVFGRERPGFYKDLICHSHKLEISSLAFCSAHQKLADVRDMCETCLHSFATENKSNSETYRTLVGKLERNTVWENGYRRLSAATSPDGLEIMSPAEDVVQVPLLKKDDTLDFPRMRYCSCCHELFSKKSPTVRLLQTKSIGAEVIELAGHDRLHSGDGSNKKQEKSLGSPASFHIEHHSFDPLSHIGYTEVKVTSDCESEVILSDDDYGAAPVGTYDVKEGPVSKGLQEEPFVELECQNVLPKALFDDPVLEKQIDMTLISPEPSCTLSAEQNLVVEHQNGDSLVPESAIAQGLEELNWNQFKVKDRPSPPPEHISEVSTINGVNEAEISYVTHCTAVMEGTDHHPVPDKVISEVSNAKSDEGEVGDAALVSSATNLEALKNSSLTETESRELQIIDGPNSLMHNHMDLNDAYKLAIGYRMNQPSPRDSYRVHEDLKLLLSQLSAARGLEFPWNDMTPSPRVQGQGDDLKLSDTSSTISQSNLNKRFSIERNESGFESLDSSIVSEIEGETSLDRLKRQLELDRKSMSLLYKELEEERNASAIAASQAMAMITRLQEEKAAMQMEAFQYQRMMEEQAEYDQEALQKSNDLLAQKEEEIQDLKSEIENFKDFLGDESLPTKMKCDSEQKEDNLVVKPPIKTSNDKRILARSDTVFLDAEGDKEVILKNSLLDIDDEKHYISECLKRLEKELHRFSNNGVYADVSGQYVREDHLPGYLLGNGHSYEKDIAQKNDSEQGNWHEMAQEDSQLGEDALVKQKESSAVGEDPHPSGEFTNKGSSNGILELSKSDVESWRSCMVSRTPDLVAIENEVLHLNDRLEALETERNFLERSINSLRCGTAGVQFIQEIASHLQELRRIVVRRRERKDT